MNRRGITLTEILISILIMGVGFTSILTLFPLGLLNVRQATRYSRSAILFNAAEADLNARGLLDKSSFTNARISPWYSTDTTWYTPAATPRTYDPWLQDTPQFKADPWSTALGFGAYRGDGPPSGPPFNNKLGVQVGPGLMVAYDPLWRQQTGLYLDGKHEARFGSGIGFIRNDPHGTNSNAPSAHGLQRITNLSPHVAFGVAPYLAGGNVAANAAPTIFVSPEDMVLQSNTSAAAGAALSSPIVPDLSFPVDPTTKMPSMQFDWKYSWMFTGSQADSTKGTLFSGDVVIFENRPFAFDEATGTVAGETVVEAIFGYTSQIKGETATSATGYGLSAKRAVLLRWPDTQPDIELRVGSWIADVTYERNATEDQQRRVTDPLTLGAGDVYSYQRCQWYRIAKRTPAEPGQAFDGDPKGVNYRQMTVWADYPLKAFTLLDAKATIPGSPYHVNAALVSPSVVNVYSITIHTK